MKNILFIHQSAELYGSDRTLLTLLKFLDKNQYQAVVVLPSVGPLKVELEKENIKVVVAPVLKLYRKMFSLKNLFSFAQDKRKAFKIMDALNEQYKFDFIYSNTLAVLLGMMYSRRRKIKHIWHVHEIIVSPKIIAAVFPKLLYKYSDLIVCNSNATRKNLTDRIANLAPKSIVIYNGIEVRNCEIKTSGSTELNSNPVVITLVGRISRLKGHKWLLNAYWNNIDKMDNVKLLFVGSPVENQEYYLTEIEEIISERKLTNVEIIPFTKDLSEIWNQTDIAVMPSTEAESFGLVALEAMLAKKPVIGSNHGGLMEIIANNATGYLIEPNNEDDLAAAILKLADNPELRKSFGENGYRKAVEKFSVAKYIQNFEKVFQEL